MPLTMPSQRVYSGSRRRVRHNEFMTERPRRRPGRPAGGQPLVDRELVLDAAERAIRRDGSGVTIDAIANEAGVTKPIVYAHVGRRNDLADALAERLSALLINAGGEALRKKRTPRTQLVALIQSNLETLAEHRELFLFVSGGVSDEMPQRTLSIADRSARPLARQLARWRTSVGAEPRVAEAWAYAIVGMLNFTALWWITSSDLPVSRVAADVAELLWSGIGSPSEPTKRASR